MHGEVQEEGTLALEGRQEDRRSIEERQGGHWWQWSQVPIPNPTSRKRYVRARPNYDAKTKTYTGLTASEMAQRRGGKVIKERSWFNWPGVYNEEARVQDWFSTPVWSVYEEEK